MFCAKLPFFWIILHNANLRRVFRRNLLRLLAADIFVFLHLICDDDIYSVHFSEIPGDVFLCFGESFRFGSKTATGCSQRFSEALGILELKLKLILLRSQLHHRIASGNDSVHLFCIVGSAGKKQVVLIFLGEIGELDFWFTGGVDQRTSLMLCTELLVAL